MSRWNLLILLATIGSIVLVALTGDADAPDPRNVQENTDTAAGPLDATHTIGQSLKFHYPNLDAIQVRWIVSSDLEYASGSRLVFHLRHREDDESDLASASILLSDLRNNEFTKFSFPPVQDSRDQSFYFFLDTSKADIQQGAVSLWASADGDMIDGQMDVNGVPASRVLAFRAYYQPDLPLLLQGLRAAAERYLTTVLFAFFVFLIPGLALLRFVKTSGGENLVERIALALGLGLAALSCGSILLLFSGAPFQWLDVAVAAGLIISLGAAWRGISLRGRAQTVSGRPAAGFGLAAWCLAGLALLSLAVGLLQIRDTTVPLWKDSPIHAGAISTILAHGNIPTDSFYHYGYHTMIALVVQLSGASIPAAMLAVGQLLITVTGLSLFLLTKRLTGSEVAALVSAACVWFLSPTPAYFITWGRYPLLLGAALLPLAAFFVVEFAEQPRFDVPTFSLLVILFWGLAFAQVRLAVLSLIFAAVVLAYHLWKTRAVRRWTITKRAALAAAAGSVLGIAWLVTLLAHGVLVQLLPQNLSDSALDLPTAAAVSLSRHGLTLLVVAGIGVGAAVWRRSSGSLITLAWFAVLYGVSLLPVVGEKYLPSALVVLLGFIPVSILVGELAELLYKKAAARSNRAAAVGVFALWLVSLFGARDIISIVNPSTMIFTDADQQAMTWISTHTPPEAAFLINSAPWFGPTYHPTDGGWWIPFLTGRAEIHIDLLPPTGQTTEAAAQWIADHNMDFVYLGTRSGVLHKPDFACQPDRYAPVYDQEGITIFRVLSAPANRLAPRAGCAGSP